MIATNWRVLRLLKNTVPSSVMTAPRLPLIDSRNLLALQFRMMSTNSSRNEDRQQLELNPRSRRINSDQNDDYLPKTTEAQDDMKQSDDLSESLTYSQEYYILHREELLQKRKEKEMEAKFGDYSARLVKRPQKNFLWGFGT